MTLFLVRLSFLIFKKDLMTMATLLYIMVFKCADSLVIEETKPIILANI